MTSTTPIISGYQISELLYLGHRTLVYRAIREIDSLGVIADNGQGMREDVRAKIFDHLFTTKVVGKGTGLGLAIARQIVSEKHGGIIEVNSTLGKGTEFVISIPMGNRE